MHRSYGLQHLRHKRRNVRFKGLRWVHTPPQPLTAHTAAYTPKQGRFERGGITTRGAFCAVRKPCVAGCQNGKPCRFWVLAGGALPKNAESLRSSDALMRVAAPRRRGPAGLRNLFRFCRNRDLYIRRSWFSACARWGWYYYSRCAPHAAETPGPRLSKRLTCRFLVSPIYICESPRRMQPISASIQIACCWISRGHIACPWLIQA